jgi:diadenosine tetraphosphate (Ap4A) HIT family hydrolase
VSNVRGPGRPLVFAGAAIRAIVPLAVAESGNITVNFDILPYAGTLTITIVADPDHMPDLAALVTALRADLAALTAASGRTVEADRPAGCSTIMRRGSDEGTCAAVDSRVITSSIGRPAVAA